MGMGERAGLTFGRNFGVMEGNPSGSRGGCRGFRFMP